jgi:hypothetical protein
MGPKYYIKHHKDIGLTNIYSGRCYYHKEEKGPLPTEKLEMLCNTSCVQDPMPSKLEQKALNIKGTVNSFFFF